MSQAEATQAKAAGPGRFVPNAKPGELGPMASRWMVPDQLPWIEAKFPGTRFKTLMIDKEKGLLTVLLQMDPGAELPDHEHVMIEQTWVIEGYLEDKDGPEAGLRVGPGEFVWRPAGSRHSAWTPEGGLMIAMFLLPNKFYDGEKVTDFLGADWEAAWGHAAG